MGESLNPTLISRASQALRPDWTRTVRARRVAAGVLVLLAGAAAIRSDPQGERVEVVVASRDLAPGTALTADDISVEYRFARTVPAGALTDVSSVLATTLAGPARRGEVLTDVRLLGSRLTEAAAGPDARIVGLHPADAALVDLVRPGDVVDVVTADDAADPPGGPRVVASGGIVVLVSDKQNHDDRVVLVALPATAAVAVAGTTLAQAVTLTLR
ncbi:SAF domain-containing protein [Mycolicibacter kumamotonensis]|jgi:Flp pilus assembly protein CpaB|uniref:Flagellar basal body P-ring biosynthesis protein FlgA n=1 Tax=Mycolicibacter kumamotonensis TaxID=354243 RepID=A0A1B8SLZ3_9MYCO|nr:SAF domain-containing protein [Mycolicibacter kumamotonensis]OBY33690.1 flagellar basal body P-ring biosynthesis protein FlgA [Mycolicibacter kumamotonensis]ORA77952.1 flagellar biosynthesis protein FlgA [Mycolicibacter kumamotonensis]